MAEKFGTKNYEGPCEVTREMTIFDRACRADDRAGIILEKIGQLDFKIDVIVQLLRGDTEWQITI